MTRCCVLMCRRYGVTDAQAGLAVLRGAPSPLRHYPQLLCWQNNTFGVKEVG